MKKFTTKQDLLKFLVENQDITLTHKGLAIGYDDKNNIVTTNGFKHGIKIVMFDEIKNDIQYG